MSYEIYKVLHILGVFLVFMALGAATLHAGNGGTRESNPQRSIVAAMHGVGLLLVIGTGLMNLSTLQGGSLKLPGWIHPKLLMWLLLGAAPVFISRMPAAARAMWVVLPLIGAAATYFALTHG